MAVLIVRLLVKALLGGGERAVVQPVEGVLLRQARERIALPCGCPQPGSRNGERDRMLGKSLDAWSDGAR